MGKKYDTSGSHMSDQLGQEWLFNKLYFAIVAS